MFTHKKIKCLESKHASMQAVGNGRNEVADRGGTQMAWWCLLGTKDTVPRCCEGALAAMAGLDIDGEINEVPVVWLLHYSESLGR